MSNEVVYFSGTSKSASHSAVYKMHKYFARRPHNQFREIIEHYVSPGGLVLDCFGGGGVTLVEALTSGRRVISIDTNEVASFVQHIEVAETTTEQVDGAKCFLVDSVSEAAKSWYVTECDSCGEDADVRWFERVYLVDCPLCAQQTELGNERKWINSSGKAVNGRYKCLACAQVFASVSVKRTGSRLISVRYKCVTCGHQSSRTPSSRDLQIDNEAINSETEHVANHAIVIPQDVIPENWDRQSEDALARKGFVRFCDLFSSRNRMVLAELVSALKRFPDDQDTTRLIAVGLVSSLIRYINNMTFSTSSWMDGRPVAWAKHAYWLPNQYVEVNPFEYLEHRAEAFRRAVADRSARFNGKKQTSSLTEVLNRSADYAIICGDSREIDLPDSSVDAVVTDPPYGSNVQYGELTHLWSIWLRELNPYHKDLFALDKEILVHRKRHANYKSFEDYSTGLAEVFQEMFRILKPGGVLVFTFNNSNARAWYSVVHAAVSAGFFIEKDGIQYLESIFAYRDTAHMRFDSQVQGDILYTFTKPTKSVKGSSNSVHTDVGSNEENDQLLLAESKTARHLDNIRQATLMITQECPEAEVISFFKECNRNSKLGED